MRFSGDGRRTGCGWVRRQALGGRGSGGRARGSGAGGAGTAIAPGLIGVGGPARRVDGFAPPQMPLVGGARATGRRAYARGRIASLGRTPVGRGRGRGRLVGPGARSLGRRRVGWGVRRRDGRRRRRPVGGDSGGRERLPGRDGSGSDTAAGAGRGAAAGRADADGPPGGSAGTGEPWAACSRACRWGPVRPATTPCRRQRGRPRSRRSTAARQGSSTGHSVQIATARGQVRRVNHRSASHSRQAARSSQIRDPPSDTAGVIRPARTGMCGPRRDRCRAPRTGGPDGPPHWPGNTARAARPGRAAASRRPPAALVVPDVAVRVAQRCGQVVGGVADAEGAAPPPARRGAVGDDRDAHAVAFAVADQGVRAAALADDRDLEVGAPAGPALGAVHTQHDPDPVAVHADVGGARVPGEVACDRAGDGACAGARGVPGEGLALQLGERARPARPASVGRAVEDHDRRAAGAGEEPYGCGGGGSFGVRGPRNPADHAGDARAGGVHADTASVDQRSFRRAR